MDDWHILTGTSFFTNHSHSSYFYQYHHHGWVMTRKWILVASTLLTNFKYQRRFFCKRVRNKINGIFKLCRELLCYVADNNQLIDMTLAVDWAIKILRISLSYLVHIHIYSFPIFLKRVWCEYLTSLFCRDITCLCGQLGFKVYVRLITKASVSRTEHSVLTGSW